MTVNLEMNWQWTEFSLAINWSLLVVWNGANFNLTLHQYVSGSIASKFSEVPRSTEEPYILGLGC